MEEIFSENEIDTNTYKEEIRQIGIGLIKSCHIVFQTCNLINFIVKLMQLDLNHQTNVQDFILCIASNIFTYVNRKAMDRGYKVFDISLSITIAVTAFL